MPVRRTKSCASCRVAKARCSLGAPCSRCAKRHIVCHYTPAQPHYRENRRIEDLRPLRPVATNSLGAGAAGLITTGAAGVPSSGIEVSRQEMIPSIAAATKAQVLNLTVLPEGFPSYQSELPDSLVPTQSITPASHGPQISSHTAVNPYFVDPLSPSWFLNFDTPSPTDVLCKFNNTPSNNALGPQLSQRARSLQQGSLTAKMIFSRLVDYTRMMADGKSLPPFINPPCCLGQGDECPVDSRHHCLPETLAICANLTQMFHSRMPGSHKFVWQQICMHLRQMCLEYEGYDAQSMLQAMQATIVYGMLCSQYTEFVSSDDAAWVVETIETFGLRLYEICAWGLDVNYVCSSRNEWILMESLRRIGCLLYLFDLLLQTDASTPSSGDCPDFIDMPLPCVRELWQPISDRDWKKRYQEELDEKKEKGRRGLTFRHLVMLRQSSRYDESKIECGSVDLTEELAEWCERVDDLSMTLWMALTIEGAGQAPELWNR